MAVDRFGGQMLIFYVFFFSSIITGLSPFTASNNFYYLFIARLLLGVCGVNFKHRFKSNKIITDFEFQGFFFCTCHNLISLWAPPEEKGMFVSSMLGSKLGIVVTWPLMGCVISYFGWESAFYITAILCLGVSYLWLETVADSPDKHPKISKSEKDFIEDSLGLVGKKKEMFPPIGEMIKSMPFYALLFLHFSDVWGIFFLLTSAPMFMNQALKFDIENVGLVSSLPYFARLICGFAFGLLGDFLTSRGMGVTTVRKLFAVFCECVLQLNNNFARLMNFYSFSSHCSRDFFVWFLLH